MEDIMNSKGWTEAFAGAFPEEGGWPGWERTWSRTNEDGLTEHLTITAYVVDREEEFGPANWSGVEAERWDVWLATEVYLPGHGEYLSVEHSEPFDIFPPTEQVAMEWAKNYVIGIRTEHLN